MEKPRLLSGEELVGRGITKLDAALPEIGLKDVVPNGSWLEQKQIQSALEARKQLIEVERIEKSGVLSHAEWREELMLAEVSRNTGGHWQYIGHHVGKQLYLKPEEALFLIEVNCLKLTFNGVTVSLQQAYSLLLRSKVSILQYKVYASLSRLGYKVYRHELKKPTECERKTNITESSKKEINSTNSKTTEEEVIKNAIENEMDVNVAGSENSSNVSDESNKGNNVSEIPKDVTGSQQSKSKENEAKYEDRRETNDSIQMEVDNGDNENTADCDKTSNLKCLNKDSIVIKENSINAIEIADRAEKQKDEEKGIITDSPTPRTEAGSNARNDMESTTKENKAADSTSDDPGIINKKYTNTTDNFMEEVSDNDNNIVEHQCISQSAITSEYNQTDNQPELYHQRMIKNLENRKLRPLHVKNTEKCFENVPDFSQNQILTVNVPEEKFIPRNVFLNNISYVLNIESIKSKTKGTRRHSNDSRAYGTNEDVNSEHVKRIRGAAGSNTPVNNHPPLFPNNRFNRPNFYNFWQPNINFFPFNFMFQRPFMPYNFTPRHRGFSPRPPLLGMYSFQPNEQRSMPNVNKRRNSEQKQKEIHLNAIKNLAFRLRQLIQSGNTQQHNIDSLQRLINTFNIKYNMRLRLTENFELFNDESIVETITLDEDEEPASKKLKTEDDEKYKENFNKLKQLALKLKSLGLKEEVNSRHRRAFSNVIKKFNKSYNADVYFSHNFEIIDRRFINLDSSSDSDCVIEETAKVSGSKKLKNPFNILKRLSEKRISYTCSNAHKDDTKIEERNNNKYSTTTIESFDKNWLPSEDDFGRAEILPKNLMNSYLLHSKREEFLYEYLKSQPFEFDNWMDIKLSFLKSIEETHIMAENDKTETPINSLVGPDDCMNMPAVLKKLSIIRNINKEVDIESSLRVDFDVYNRDVQNFKKSSRPKPHFRVVCISDTSKVPSAKEVASLHLKYDDNVTIVFAIVGVGSISYLQINPIDLPVYIPSNDDLA